MPSQLVLATLVLYENTLLLFTLVHQYLLVLQITNSAKLIEHCRRVPCRLMLRDLVYIAAMVEWHDWDCDIQLTPRRGS